MNTSRHELDQRAGPENGTVRLPKPFPLVRYYLLASVLLVIGAFAILNFSTQRIQSGTAINSLKQEAESDVTLLAFEVSLALTAFLNPGDDLATVVGERKVEFDRAIINALSGYPVPRLDLVAPTGALAYSTDPEAELAVSGDEINRAFAGTPFSNYDQDYSLTLFNGEPVDIATVMTATAINTEWSVESTGPVAVLVAFRDVTDAVPSVTGAVAPERIAVLGGTMAGLFVLLSWIVIGGHRSTTDARERLAEMLDVERDMRGQLDIRNSELEEANRAKTQFLTMISHELKTPLTAIISFAGSLNKSLAQSLSDREVRQFEALSRNGNLLKALIDELLDVSAAASGKLNLVFEQVTAASVVDEAVQLVQPMIEARNQHVSVRLPAQDLTFSADPGRMKQVLANLLSNASKYSPADSEIIVEASPLDGRVRFSVSDTGIGISAEDQERLFTTFFRTEKAVESGAPGTGIGLVIVKSILEGHSGAVSIDSEPGSGTSVHVEIPEQRPASSDLSGDTGQAA